jgi:hypothetical protein
VDLTYQIFSTLGLPRTQTPCNDDSPILGQSLAYGVQAFLDRIVNKSTGIDNDQIGTLEGLGRLVTLCTELRKYQLGISERLGASKADKANLGGPSKAG